MRAAEARCGVAAALIGSQGVETHVSSVVMDHVIGHCWQSEVSAERGEKILRLGLELSYFDYQLICLIIQLII